MSRRTPGGRSGDLTGTVEKATKKLDTRPPRSIGGNLGIREEKYLDRNRSHHDEHSAQKMTEAVNYNPRDQIASNTEPLMSKQSSGPKTDIQKDAEGIADRIQKKLRTYIVNDRKRQEIIDFVLDRQEMILDFNKFLKFKSQKIREFSWKYSTTWEVEKYAKDLSKEFGNANQIGDDKTINALIRTLSWRDNLYDPPSDRIRNVVLEEITPLMVIAAQKIEKTKGSMKFRKKFAGTVQEALAGLGLAESPAKIRLLKDQDADNKMNAALKAQETEAEEAEARHREKIEQAFSQAAGKDAERRRAYAARENMHRETLHEHQVIQEETAPDNLAPQDPSDAINKTEESDTEESKTEKWFKDFEEYLVNVEEKLRNPNLRPKEEERLLAEYAKYQEFIEQDPISFEDISIEGALIQDPQQEPQNPNLISFEDDPVKILQSTTQVTGTLVDLPRQEALPPVSGEVAANHRDEFFDLMATNTATPVEPNSNQDKEPYKEDKAEKSTTPIDPGQGTREEIEKTFNANDFPTAPTVKPASARGVNNKKPTSQKMAL